MNKNRAVINKKDGLTLWSKQKIVVCGISESCNSRLEVTKSR